MGRSGSKSGKGRKGHGTVGLVGLRLFGDVIVKWRYGGNFIFGKLIYAKDYSVGDGEQGVEGKGVKYVGDGAVMYRIIFLR